MFVNAEPEYVYLFKSILLPSTQAASELRIFFIEFDKIVTLYKNKMTDIYGNEPGT